MEYDLLVIGAGAAGLSVAAGAAGLGAKVALIEKEKLGGDCLYYGCVPSKTLIHTAKVFSLMNRADEFGINPVHPTHTFANITKNVQGVIKSIGRHDDPQRLRKMGVDVVIGEASFLSPHEVKVKEKVLTAKKIVIATGSRQYVPQLAGLKETGFLTHVDIFSLQRMPSSLIILGGGPIGVEMCQAFTRLGCKVTLVEMSDHILIRDDADAAFRLQGIMEKEGATILCNTKAIKVVRRGKLKEVTIEGGGSKSAIQAEEILLAAGRAPNVEGLHLEAAGVRYDQRKIIVDERLRTSQKHIYACGDINGQYLFTHVASYEAGVVIKNALFHLPAKADYTLVPWTTYTDPELAHIGLTEEVARQQHSSIKRYTHSFKDIDRAEAEHETEGFIKVICDRKGHILGVTILGPHAGELLHEWALAMSANITIKKIANMIHAYPTLSLGSKDVAFKYYKEIASEKTKNIIKRLFGLRGA